MAVDIPGLKTDIKSILDTANDTTATYDLSEGLSRRVATVNTFNPERLHPNSIHLPGVFIWTQAKKVQLETINMSLASGKRRAEILFSLAGIVWVPYTTDVTEDPADDDCEKLMENIEEVLRASDTLGGKAKWHITSDITYHNSPYDESSHMRVGLMALRATVFY